MSLTLNIAQLRDDIKKHVGTTSGDTGFDNDSVDLLANRTLWSLLNRYPFRETEKTATFPTTIGSRSYSLPTSFDALRHLSIEDLDSKQHSLITRMTPEEYENVRINDSTANGKPERYFREGACLFLWPTPDHIYTVTFKYLVTLQDLDDGNTGFPLPKNWYEIVLYGAVSRGFIFIKNFEMATNYANLQAKEINDTVPVEAKEEKDSRYAGVAVYGYNPQDIYDS